MNQDNVYCSINHHEANLITDVCTFKYCKHYLRWCCKECKKNSIHDHKQQYQKHLVPHQKLQSILRQNITKLLEFHQEHLNQHKIEELRSYFLQCEKMTIPIYKRDFEQLQNNIKSNENKLLKYLEMIQDCNIFNLESNLLNEIINIQYDQSVYDYLLLYNTLKDNVTLKLGRNKILLNQNYEPKQYIIKKVDQGQEIYQCCSISNDMRYLAYGVEDLPLKIYDICSNKVIQEKKVEFPIMSCQFSSDSQYLYVGTIKQVIVYHITNIFKKIFILWFNSHGVQRILLLKNQQMITCATLKITKIDLKSRKAVFVIMRKRDFTTALDYNDEIIAVGHSSGSLMFWDCRKMAIIIDKKYHNYSLSQIQIINSGHQILCADINGNLVKYQIDIINKDIIKIQSFDFGYICSFQQVNQRQNLLIICRDSFLILNKNGDVIKKVYYLEQQFSFQNIFQNDNKQLDNLKYVILRSKCKNIQPLLDSLFLAIAQG